MYLLIGVYNVCIFYYYYFILQCMEEALHISHLSLYFLLHEIKFILLHVMLLFIIML